MASVIVMPRLSPTMEEGVLLKWTKKEGEHVSPGDVIAEVETDKANMDFPLEDEGTLLKLMVKEGDTVKLGAPVAVLGEPGEDYAALVGGGDGGETKTPIAGTDITPKQAPIVADKNEGQTEPRTVAAPVVAPAPAPAPVAEPARGGLGVVRASPLARKLAYERGLELKDIAGSGPGGRVVKRDVESAAARPAPVAAKAPPAPAPVAVEDQIVPHTPMRRTVARRLTESKSTVPHFYVTMDAQADALFAFYQQVKDASETKITVNDLVLRAVAVALKRVPEANVSWSEAGLIKHGAVHLGVAVSIDDGLVTPVIKNADSKSLGTIAREARDLIERARARKLRGDEFTGSTFSVSNMGMLGVKSFSAVINPPDSGILAVGAMEKRAVVVTDEAGNDHIVAKRMMTLTISSDHRVMDGALAAKLLGEIVKIIERPFSLVL